MRGAFSLSQSKWANHILSPAVVGEVSLKEVVRKAPVGSVGADQQVNGQNILSKQGPRTTLGIS